MVQCQRPWRNRDVPTSCPCNHTHIDCTMHTERQQHHQLSPTTREPKSRGCSSERAVQEKRSLVAVAEADM
eukprot:6485644-Amphidinium_carterae.2